MIKIFPDNTASREQPPKFLRGLKQESLFDLSWTDPALGVQDFAWWPEEKQYPEYDPDTQKLGAETITPDHDRKVALVTYSVDEIPAEEIAEKLETEKNRVKAEINTVRYSKIYMESIPYTFPGDTEPDGIQMRDETDRQNIQDFVIDASNKDPETVMYWMPVSNQVKAMTAAQAVEMGQYLKDRGDQIMTYSWQIKGQVNAAETIEALNAISIQEGWPE